jgi:glucokinase
MSSARLVADAGGTNVRFAIADDNGRLDRVQIFQVADFPTFLDALSAYRSSAGGLSDIKICAVAAAGPVDGDIVKLTNNAWVVDRSKVSALMGGAAVALVNDLEAVAAALPHLTSDDLTAIGAPAPVRPEQRTMLAVNVGTGFGAASAIWRGGCWHTCPSEAGHMTLATQGSIEASALPADACVESVLSGGGLARLYDRLAGDQRAGGTSQATAVFAEAAHNPAAARAVDTFTSVLGRVAGDLALATCAWGGVYLCGSVAVAWSAIADAGRFRAEFTRKGLLSARMRQVPIAVIRRDLAPLFGLAMMPIPR